MSDNKKLKVLILVDHAKGISGPLRQTIGQNARSHVINAFSEKTLGEKLEKVFKG